MPSVALILVGAIATLAAAYSLGRLLPGNARFPPTIDFAIGAAVLSHVVFLLLAAGVGRGWVVTGLVVVLALPLFRIGSWKAITAGSRLRMSRPVQWAFAAVLAVFGVFYFVHALAPEIQPDATTYHLGLVREWLRLGGFPHRVGFYEMLPEGLEMLFTPAYAIGQHSATKLVHFAFLAMTVPLLFQITRQLKLPDWTAAAATVLYVCSPVVGISGTAAYNDAALVFFVLATFYLLLRWDARGENRELLAAGLAAGFCYSIKFTGLLIAPAALVFILLRNWRRAWVFVIAASAMIGPWMIRNAVRTGNPLAPLFNSVFVNPYFHVSTEQQLTETLRSYGGVSLANLPLELSLRGDLLQGLIGPVFLLAPVALLALRKRAGRAVLLAAGILAVPWLFNLGTRFLMPALVFLALAIIIALPRRLAFAVVALHAVSCLPPVVNLYAGENAWVLRGLPWRAALRIENESDYLQRTLTKYPVAEMVRSHVPAGQWILDLAGAPRAWFDATAVEPWHSAVADRAADALGIGFVVGRGVFTEISASWSEQPLTALRIRQTAENQKPWSIQEVRLFRGGDHVARNRKWRLAAWPNVWEAPLAMDGNRVTRWATWEPARPGMYFQMLFNSPQPLTGVELVCLEDENQTAVEFLGRTTDGKWRRLAGEQHVALQPAVNLRRSAMRALRGAGFQYILAPVTDGDYAKTGASLVRNPAEWGVEAITHARGVYLLRVY